MFWPLNTWPDVYPSCQTGCGAVGTRGVAQNRQTSKIFGSVTETRVGSPNLLFVPSHLERGQPKAHVKICPKRPIKRRQNFTGLRLGRFVCFRFVWFLGYLECLRDGFRHILTESVRPYRLLWEIKWPLFCPGANASQ